MSWITDSGAVRYLDDTFPGYTMVDKPLWWHLRGLSQTASGYGRKLTSSRCVLLPGEKRPRRIYVTCFSNCGTAWVTVKGLEYVVRD